MTSVSLDCNAFKPGSLYYDLFLSISVSRLTLSTFLLAFAWTNKLSSLCVVFLNLEDIANFINPGSNTFLLAIHLF